MSTPEPFPFTKRAQEINPFIVMDVLERAQALTREGRSIVHLEVGEPDFDSPPEALAAAAEALKRGETHYTHSLGVLELREAISRRYKRIYGVDVSPERILVTCGSSPALLYVFAALVEPGDEVICPSPRYACYPNFVHFFGGKLVPVPTELSDGWRADPERLRRAITPRTKAVLINSPSNPTGAVLDGDRLQAIAKLDLPIVSDEIYHGLTYEGRERSILEFTDRAFVLDGFSKRYAMTGWRLGWLVVPEGCMRPFQKMQQNIIVAAGAFSQRGGVAALDHGDAFVDRLRTEYDRRRKILVQLLREAGFGIPVPPQGAFYVLADASKFTDDGYAFAFELLEKAGVGVAPGIDFGEEGRRAVRFSYSTSEANIREGVRRVREYLVGRVKPSKSS